MDNLPSIPRRFKGDKITAEDHNNLAKAVANIARSTPVTHKNFAPVSHEYHPFEFYNVRKSGGAWDVRIEPGFVIETNIQLSTVTKTWTPEIAATPMTDATLAVPIRITIADGDEIYLTFETNQKGLISAAPKIEVTTSTGAVHHVPPSPGNSGTNGVYKIKIATCTITNSVMFIEDVELRDNFYWPNQLIELENVGSEAEIVKAFDATNNKHPHRTLKGDGTDPGSGSDIHDLYLTATQNADTIAFSGKVEIAGSGTSSSHPWKVTGNGDATVDVAAGKLLSFVSESSPGISNIPSYFQLKEFADYAGGTIGSIGAAGFIYASISYTTNQTIFDADTTTGISTFDRVVPDGSVAVAFATSLPTTGDVFIVELARVTFAAGVATVSDQVVTHNPTLWSFDIAPEPL
tara:strand:- start:550 stop:1767 length:1218 start_codon:yes stop_codon:yes gene_type:complete